jgi:hypothetical protein
MVGSLHAFYQHIVDVDFNISADLVLEHFVHQPLISGSSILQPKGHHSVTIETSISHKSGFLLVYLIHVYLVESTNRVHPRERETILRASFVQISEVHAYPPLSIGLLSEDNIG